MPNEISSQDYQVFSTFLEKECGISLGTGKEYLVISRLGPLLKELHVDSFNELIKQVCRGSQSAHRERIIDVMTTNETSWFRDVMPYEMLKNRVLDDLAKKSPMPLRIWSAACSSGQEPYTISMTLDEYASSHPGRLTSNIDIIATDISAGILQQAKSGYYDKLSMMRGLSDERKQRFFTQHGDIWQVNQKIRDSVKFRVINLLEDYGKLGKFDIIFCRNVLIYFTTELKVSILNRLAGALNPGGYLFVGGSESVSNHVRYFETVRDRNSLAYRLK